MINLYIESRNIRTLLGTYATHAEVEAAKNKWLKENDYECANRTRICQNWIASDGEKYEDFGSWVNFFVEVYS